MTSRNRKRERRRGTASVEVVAMLPFFILVYAGIYFMHAHYAGRQQAMLTARTCAWKFAAEGCPEDKHDELTKCLAPTGSRGETVDVPADTAPPPDRHQGAGDTVGRVLDTIEKIPVLGSAVSWLFGKPIGVAATKSVTMPRPLVANREKAVVTGSYYTMCNSMPKKWSTLAHDIFCSVIGKGSLGC